MLTGTFTEADQTRVPIPHTSSRALNCLIHFLYTCSPDTCPQYDDLAADTLLELVQLSDQYLLTDLNLSVCHTIIRHSASTQFLTPIYRSAVQSSYPVNCVGRWVLIKQTFRGLVSRVKLWTLHYFSTIHWWIFFFSSGVLSNSIVNYLLVGNLSHKTRVELMMVVMRSDLAQHLLDDVSKTLREKLQNTASTSSRALTIHWAKQNEVSMLHQINFSFYLSSELCSLYSSFNTLF